MSYLQSLRVIVGDSVDKLLIWHWFWLGAGFWFWLRFNAGFRVWFGGGVCCFAACPRLWALLFGWALSMLAPILLPSCSLLMWRTTAVALKACCYTQTQQKSIADGPSCSIQTYDMSGCLLTGLTYPPLALGKIFTHLTADGFVDVLAESSVSSNPGKKKQHAWNDYSCISGITIAANNGLRVWSNNRQIIQVRLTRFTDKIYKL